MTRPNEPVPSVLMRSKSSRAAVLVGLRFHLSSNSSLAWSRNSLTLSAASTFLLDDVALFPIVKNIVLLVLVGMEDSEDVEAWLEVLRLVFEVGDDEEERAGGKGCCCCGWGEGEVVEGELGERSDDEVNNRREEESELGSFESSVYRFLVLTTGAKIRSGGSRKTRVHRNEAGIYPDE